MQPENLYLYRAKLVSVYDGDTITVNIDLGFGIIQNNVHIRLYGINAPELKGSSKEKGKIAKDFLVSKIIDKEIFIQTIKDKTEKFGRLLGIIYVYEDGDLININNQIVESGNAIEFMVDK